MKESLWAINISCLTALFPTDSEGVRDIAQREPLSNSGTLSRVRTLINMLSGGLRPPATVSQPFGLQRPQHLANLIQVSQVN
jgi:hypothetical protein